MKRVEYPAALKGLIDELKRLPGVGPRSAERIALWMVQKRDARPGELARAIGEMIAQVKPCKQCGFFAEDELCEICRDVARDPGVICVVEQPTDILPLERSGAFKGLYHTLGGRISPLDHIGPEDLRIDSLVERVRSSGPKELILALGADVEGEATASYLGSILRGLASPPNLTRLAQGIPAGGGLEFTDELTLSRAITGRTQL
jgi:recombination protein RecR